MRANSLLLFLIAIFGILGTYFYTTHLYTRSQEANFIPIQDNWYLLTEFQPATSAFFVGRVLNTTHYSYLAFAVLDSEGKTRLRIYIHEISTPIKLIANLTTPPLPNPEIRDVVVRKINNYYYVAAVFDSGNYYTICLYKFSNSLESYNCVNKGFFSAVSDWTFPIGVWIDNDGNVYVSGFLLGKYSSGSGFTDYVVWLKYNSDLQLISEKYHGIGYPPINRVAFKDDNKFRTAYIYYFSNTGYIRVWYLKEDGSLSGGPYSGDFHGPWRIILARYIVQFDGDKLRIIDLADFSAKTYYIPQNLRQKYANVISQPLQANYGGPNTPTSGFVIYDTPFAPGKPLLILYRSGEYGNSIVGTPNTIFEDESIGTDCLFTYYSTYLFLLNDRFVLLLAGAINGKYALYYKDIPRIIINIEGIKEREVYSPYNYPTVRVNVTGAVSQDLIEKIYIKNYCYNNQTIIYQGPVQSTYEFPLLGIPPGANDLIVEVLRNNYIIAQEVVHFFYTYPEVTISVQDGQLYVNKQSNFTIEISRMRYCPSGEQYPHYNVYVYFPDNITCYTNPPVPITNVQILPKLDIEVTCYPTKEGKYPITVNVTALDVPYTYSETFVLEAIRQICKLNITYDDGTTNKEYTIFINKTKDLYIKVRNIDTKTCEYFLYIKDLSGEKPLQVWFNDVPAKLSNSYYVSQQIFTIQPGEEDVIKVTIRPIKQGTYYFKIGADSNKFNIQAQELGLTVYSVVETCRALVQLSPESVSLWAGQTKNLTLSVTNMGNRPCTYSLSYSCPSDVGCVLATQETPVLNPGDTYSTILYVTGTKEGTYHIKARATAIETAETFESNEVVVTVTEPVKIEVISPSTKVVHTPNVTVKVRVYTEYPFTNTYIKVVLDDQILCEFYNKTDVTCSKKVPISEGKHTISVIFTSKEYKISKQFEFTNQLVKYVRVNSPKAGQIFNVSDEIPIDVEAELWTVLTNAKLLIYIDGSLFKEIPVPDVYIRYTTKVKITEPGPHTIYAVLKSKEVTRVSDFIYFSVGMPPDYKVYNTTYIELHDNELEKIYNAWKTAIKEVNTNELEKIAKEYITTFLDIEDNEEIEKLAKVYVTNFLEMNDNDMRKLFYHWLTYKLAVEDNDLSKILKEYLTTHKEINENDLYKIFREYLISNIASEDNDLRKIFSEWLINQISTEINNLNKIFSEFKTPFIAYEINPLSGIIHEIKVYPTHFIILEENELEKVFKPYKARNIAVEESPMNMFRTFVVKFLELGENALNKIFGVFSTIFRYGQLNPKIGIKIVGEEEATVKLLTDRCPICNSILEFEAVMPEAQKEFYYEIDTIVDGVTVCKYTFKYTFYARGVCIAKGIGPGEHTVQVVMTRYIRSGMFWEEDLQRIDTKKVYFYHEPFNLEVKPTGSIALKQNEALNLTINYVTSPILGMAYRLDIIVYNSTGIASNWTQTIQPATQGTLTYQIYFPTPGQYKVEVILKGICTYINDVIDTRKAEIFVTVQSVAPTPPSGGGAPTGGAPTVTPPTNVTQPPAIIPVQQNITPVQPRPTGVQSVVGYLTQRPWLIALVVLFIVLLVIMYTRSRSQSTIYVVS